MLGMISLGFGAAQTYHLLTNLPRLDHEQSTGVSTIISDINNPHAPHNATRVRESNVGRGHMHMPHAVHTTFRVQALEHQRRADFSNPVFHRPCYIKNFKDKHMDAAPHFMMDPLIGNFQPRSRTHWSL